jgi:hypothetical protein
MAQYLQLRKLELPLNLWLNGVLKLTHRTRRAMVARLSWERQRSSSSFCYDFTFKCNMSPACVVLLWWVNSHLWPSTHSVLVAQSFHSRLGWYANSTNTRIPGKSWDSHPVLLTMVWIWLTMGTPKVWRLCIRVKISATDWRALA